MNQTNRDVFFTDRTAGGTGKKPSTSTRASSSAHTVSGKRSISAFSADTLRVTRRSVRLTSTLSSPCRLLRSAPKVFGGQYCHMADQSVTKVWFGSFLSAHLVRFPYCVLLFVCCVVAVQVTFLSLARLERSRTRTRCMCGSWTHLLDSECTVCISAAVESSH